MSPAAPLGLLARDLLAVPHDAGALFIEGIALDSRKVRPGFLFAALPGTTGDGRRHIADAVAHGAVAVLAPPGTPWPDGVAPVPLVTTAEPRRALARLAAVHAGPQPERMVAVTGTNGKTSTADFLRQLWTLDGIPAARLGPLGLSPRRRAPPRTAWPGPRSWPASPPAACAPAPSRPARTACTSSASTACSCPPPASATCPATT